MTVKKLVEIEREQYQTFVATHPSGSFLQSWGWGEFQATQNKLPIRYGIFDNSGLTGSVQLFKTKVPYLPGYYLYAPYGPILQNQNLLETLITQIKKDYPDAWFIRLEPKQDIPLSGEVTVHIQPGKTLITDITQPIEDLLAGMHKKTRYDINLSNKHGIVVNSSQASIEQGLQLLAETSKRQGFHSYPKSYYESLMDALDKPDSDCKARLYQASYQNKVISSAIMIDYHEIRTYLFGGSNNAYRAQMAPYALHWQAIRDAKQAGLKYYDWWGIQTATGKVPGFVQFKLRWGGREISYPPAKDLIWHRTWYSIYKLLRKLNRLL